jgi:glycine hydroxymethyltransferase
MQGGPLEHVIAGKAVAFGEALTPAFEAYGKRVMENAQALAQALVERNFQLISGGTDNHCMLIDLSNKDITGKAAEAALGKAGITVNKNMVPFDTRSPFVTSGIRVGTPAVTTRGIDPEGCVQIAQWMDEALKAHENDAALAAIHDKVRNWMADRPLFSA